jgi:hypothetical protein
MQGSCDDSGADQERHDQEALKNWQRARDAIQPVHEKSDRDRACHDKRRGGNNAPVISYGTELPERAAYSCGEQDHTRYGQGNAKVRSERAKSLGADIEIVTDENGTAGRSQHEAEIDQKGRQRTHVGSHPNMSGRTRAPPKH